jgi:hypothetical protein
MSRRFFCSVVSVLGALFPFCARELLYELGSATRRQLKELLKMNPKGSNVYGQKLQTHYSTPWGSHKTESTIFL